MPLVMLRVLGAGALGGVAYGAALLAVPRQAGIGVIQRLAGDCGHQVLQEELAAHSWAAMGGRRQLRCGSAAAADAATPGVERPFMAPSLQHGFQGIAAIHVCCSAA